MATQANLSKPREVILGVATRLFSVPSGRLMIIAASLWLYPSAKHNRAAMRSRSGSRIIAWSIAMRCSSCGKTAVSAPAQRLRLFCTALMGEELPPTDAGQPGEVAALTPPRARGPPSGKEGLLGKIVARFTR